MVVYAALYENEERLKETAEKLIQGGLAPERLETFGRADVSRLEETLDGGRFDEMLRPMANRMRKALAAGQSILVVDAPMFYGAGAESILYQSGAIKIHVSTAGQKHAFSAVPLLRSPKAGRTSSFSIPLLSKFRLSSMVGMPLLVQRRKERR